MANEMTVYKAITTAGQAIVSMAQSVKINRSVRKQDAAVFQEQLHYIKAACRAKGYGELTRLSVDEMEKLFKESLRRIFLGRCWICLWISLKCSIKPCVRIFKTTRWTK